MNLLGKSTMQALSAYSARYRLYFPVLVALGIFGSLAESVGLSLIVLLLSMVLGSGTAMLSKGILGRLYDVTSPFISSSTHALAGMILAFVLLRIVMNMIYGLTSLRLRHSVSEDIRIRLFDAYLHMPYKQFQAEEVGTLHDTLAQHSWAVADAFAKVARMGANIGSILIFGIFITALSPPAALIAAIGSVILFGLTATLGKRATSLGEESIKSNAILTERILSSIEAARTIRAHVREPWAVRRFRSASRRMRHRYEAIETMQIILYPLTEIGYLTLLGGIAMSSAAFGITPTATFAAVLLLYRVQPQLRELERNRLELAGHAASIQSVQLQLGNWTNEQPTGRLPYRGLGKGIEFERVSFRHDPDTPLLEAVSFHIPAQGITVLSGASGRGKTTIVNLLLQLYSPVAGRILIGDTPLSELHRTQWLRRVAIAGQDADLMAGTIAENIRFGRLNASDADLWEAARDAAIADTIRALPKGMKTLVGERGTKLSGGQRQRIGIARALLRNPDLLILDEATNAVEEGLEASILRTIAAKRRDRATILITHRTAALSHGAVLIDIDASEYCPDQELVSDADPRGQIAPAS
jgi:subfamily B ATP-binding cassette protein MsbA